MDNLPIFIISPLAAMGAGQIWKVFAPLLWGKRPDIRELLRSGGMPSAHSASAAALAMTSGLREGFSSGIFAVAALLTVLVAHDAVKVRGTINSLLDIAKRTVSPQFLEQTRNLPDTVGHDFKEVIVGIIMGVLIGMLVHFFFLKP